MLTKLFLYYPTLTTPQSTTKIMHNILKKCINIKKNIFNQATMMLLTPKYPSSNYSNCKVWAKKWSIWY